MVETPAGCLFEDIQYEDIQVEAVTLNFLSSSGGSGAGRWLG